MFWTFISARNSTHCIAGGQDAIIELFDEILTGTGELFQQGVNLVSKVIQGEDVSDTVNEAVQVGVDATEQAAKIGAQAVSDAPKIVEETVAFAQGLGKTVQEHSGLVKQSLTDISTQAKA
jgi:hypothetical protein